LEQPGEFEDFEVAGVVGPVVAPADDEVAAGGGVGVVAEVFALELEFDADALPAAGADLAFGVAVGEFLVDGFDDEAEVFGEHAEEEDDAEFVEGFVKKAGEGSGIAVGGLAGQLGVPGFAGRRPGRGMEQKRRRRGSLPARFVYVEGEKSQNVGPLALALGEIAEGLGHGGVPAKAIGERAGIVIAEEEIDAAGREAAVLAHGTTPVFEEKAVRETQINGMGPKAGGANGGRPSGKAVQDGTEGNAGTRKELGARRRATEAAGDAFDGFEDLLFVGHGCRRVSGGSVARWRRGCAPVPLRAAEQAAVFFGAETFLYRREVDSAREGAKEKRRERVSRL
jgi:hypothetical protein